VRFVTLVPTAADASSSVTRLHASTDAITACLVGVGVGDGADDEPDDPQPAMSNAAVMAGIPRRTAEARLKMGPLVSQKGVRCQWENATNCSPIELPAVPR
jgi:hypothetical protein